MLLPPATLACLLACTLVRHANRLFHLVHRTLFAGLLFYLPPSDEDIQARALNEALGAGGTKSLNSKLRKRVAKRTGILLDPESSSSGEQLELQLASINASIYAASDSRRFFQLQSFIGVNAAILALILAEQCFACWTVRNTEQQPQASDTSLPSTEHTPAVAGSTILALAFGLLYNLYVGLRFLASNRIATAESDDGSVNGATKTASNEWSRTTGLVALLAFVASLVIQSNGRLSSLTTTFFATDATQYAAYLNQVGYNTLVAVHGIVDKSVASVDSGSSQALDLAWLPPKPASVADVHLHTYFPLVTFKLVLALVCAAMSVAFFTGAWRYARLLKEKLDDNAELFDETASSIATADPLAPPPPSMSLRRHARLLGSTLVWSFNFLTPLLVVAMWVPSVSLRAWLRVFAASDDAADTYLAWRRFEVFRTVFVLACLLLRLAQVRAYLQTFLLSSLALIRALPNSSGVGAGSTATPMDARVTLRIQTLLKSIFWYAPHLALQYMYPIVFGLALLAAHKLADETLPAGHAAWTTGGANQAGWGLCQAMFGRGNTTFALPLHLVSPAGMTSITPAVVPAATPTPTAPTAGAAAAPFDADEFDGELPVDDDFGEPVATTTTATPASAAPLAGAPSIVAASSFVAPNRTNVLASALGFLLVWSHLVWFVQTALCYSYLRFVHPSANRRKPVSMAAAKTS